MKRFVSLILIITSMMVLIACGGSKTTDVPQSPRVQKPNEPAISFDEGQKTHVVGIIPPDNTLPDAEIDAASDRLDMAWEKMKQYEAQFKKEGKLGSWASFAALDKAIANGDIVAYKWSIYELTIYDRSGESSVALYSSSLAIH